jgi:two-component system sensor histidine kinase/response regulator
MNQRDSTMVTKQGACVTILDPIPGLDVETGLKTVGGRMESLTRLLRKYGELHADDSRILREGIAGGELEAARRLAHSLKGAAGFLGLLPIQALSGELEAALREGAPRDQVERLLEAFECENAAVCAAIQALPPAP